MEMDKEYTYGDVLVDFTRLKLVEHLDIVDGIVIDWTKAGQA